MDNSNIEYDSSFVVSQFISYSPCCKSITRLIYGGHKKGFVTNDEVPKVWWKETPVLLMSQIFEFFN